MQSFYKIAILLMLITKLSGQIIKKRGLENVFHEYNKQHDSFILGGPIDLGDIHGIALENYHQTLGYWGLGPNYYDGVSFEHHGLDLGGKDLFSFDSTSGATGTKTDTDLSDLSSGCAQEHSKSGSAIVNTAQPTQIESGTVNGPNMHDRLIPKAGTLGSGSLGYVSLGNGLFALGSGSLGYSPPASSNSAGIPQHQSSETNIDSTRLLTNTAEQQVENAEYGGYSLNGNRLGVYDIQKFN